MDEPRAAVQKGSASEWGCQGAALQDSDVPRDRSSVPASSSTPRPSSLKVQSATALMMWQKLGIVLDRLCLKFRLVQQARSCHIGRGDQVHCICARIQGQQACLECVLRREVLPKGEEDKRLLTEFSYEKG